MPDDGDRKLQALPFLCRVDAHTNEIGLTQAVRDRTARDDVRINAPEITGHRWLARQSTSPAA